jgi:uncharacterized membrane protein
MQNDPPVQASPASAAVPAKSSTGLDENVAALLSYIFGWISGLIFFLIEKDSRLVRFHAMQSLLLNIVAVILGIGIWILSVLLFFIVAMASSTLASLLSMLVGLLGFVVLIGLLIAVILCLVKAYQGQYFKLPVIGNFAEKFSQK